MKKIFLFLSLLAVLVITGACSPHQGLRMDPVPAAGVSGNVDLILFGCRYLDDPETVAIFDREGDPYTFDIFSPDFNYRTVKGLPAGKALEVAHQFIMCHTSARGERMSSLVDDKGNILGYELRPLYFALTYGVDDILLTDYRIKDGKVVVRIWLDPLVENMLSDGDSRSNGRER